MTKNVSVHASRITDWDSFHDIFAETFGFPGFYGRNTRHSFLLCVLFKPMPDQNGERNRDEEKGSCQIKERLTKFRRPTQVQSTTTGRKVEVDDEPPTGDPQRPRNVENYIHVLPCNDHLESFQLFIGGMVRKHEIGCRVIAPRAMQWRRDAAIPCHGLFR